MMQDILRQAIDALRAVNLEVIQNGGDEGTLTRLLLECEEVGQWAKEELAARESIRNEQQRGGRANRES